VKKALGGPHRQSAENATIDEIKNILDYKVGTYVTWETLTKMHKTHVLRSFMFLKDKFTPGEK
jgi:hypothetical protein